MEVDDSDDDDDNATSTPSGSSMRNRARLFPQRVAKRLSMRRQGQSGEEIVEDEKSWWRDPYLLGSGPARNAPSSPLVARRILFCKNRRVVTARGDGGPGDKPKCRSAVHDNDLANHDSATRTRRTGQDRREGPVSPFCFASMSTVRPFLSRPTHCH